MSAHNLCFEQKYEKQSFLSENFQILEVKFSIYFNRQVFVMHLVPLNQLPNTIQNLHLEYGKCPKILYTIYRQRVQTEGAA